MRFSSAFLDLCINYSANSGNPERVRIEVGVKSGTDIRPVGCDVPIGQVIFASSRVLSGCKLDSALPALLSCVYASVRRLLFVYIIMRRS